MGNLFEKVQFTTLGKDGALMSEELIHQFFAKSETDLKVLVNESKSLSVGGFLSFTIKEKTKYSTALSCTYYKVQVYVCKRVDDTNFQSFVFSCDEFSYKVDLEHLKQLVSAVTGMITTEPTFSENVVKLLDSLKAT